MHDQPTQPTERKTPRTDAAERRCHDEEGLHNLVLVEDMAALEIETQELAEALELVLKMLLEWHNDLPDLVGPAEPAAVDAAESALARHRAQQGGAS